MRPATDGACGVVRGEVVRRAVDAVEVAAESGHGRIPFAEGLEADAAS